MSTAQAESFLEVYKYVVQDFQVCIIYYLLILCLSILEILRNPKTIIEKFYRKWFKSYVVDHALL